MPQQLAHTTIPAWFLDRWLECAIVPRGYGTWRLPPGWQRHRSYRRSYELYYLLDGGMVTSIADREFALAPHNALLLPPGTPFVDRDAPAGNGTHLLSARFSVVTAGAFDPLTTLGLPVAVALRQPTAINQLCRGTAGANQTRRFANPRFRLRVRSLIDLIIGQFLADGFTANAFAAIATDPMPKWLWQVLGFIEQHLDRRELHVGDLAREAGLSESHLTHQFRAYLDTSPKRWVRRRRINAARRLLTAEPHLPMADIAEQCGFTDAFQFSRAFSRHMGLAPSHWRKRIIEQDADEATAEDAPGRD